MHQITLDDLLSQEAIQNPCPFYAHLRMKEPLTRFTDIDGTDAWLVTSYNEALALLTDPRFTNTKQQVSSQQDGQRALQESTTDEEHTLSAGNMLSFTHLRPLVAKAFTPRRVEQLRLRIQQIADALLDAVHRQGKMDLIADFAYPLPITVILELLGIPGEDRQTFRAWSQAIVSTPNDSEQEEVRAVAHKELTHYIATLLSTRRKLPGNDLVSDLVMREENERKLHEQELTFIIFVLLIAGHETTANLIGTSMLALLEHPLQLQVLRDDPSLIPVAVEELLRYTAPVSTSGPRWAREDVVIESNVIRRGQAVYVSLVAANCDPQQFTAPEELDITRQGNQHLAFGKGIHFCLGAPLARLEGQIALSTLLRRMPHLRRASKTEQFVWKRDLFLRGVTSLPVTFSI
ncbi:cytochrome P450 [Ktedonosporobacter rubrisoli]|uniref:Cytochrome P450 n=1 Tax=Ktedonosporobacter rubrisoli TaxID=2509675 RepID=A0A4P6JP71_KTERU|nr:cytochrome P450 [Ktedonosporobacter rubrisoli]QBD77169.1 cytochrome P450 [Ktedonosporobacter rubrisoli]